MGGPDETVLRERIFEVLKDADLSIVSAKKIRAALAEMPDGALPAGLDLVEQKKDVDAVIRSCYDEVTAKRKLQLPGKQGADGGGDSGEAPPALPPSSTKAPAKRSKAPAKKRAADAKDGEPKKKRAASANSPLNRPMRLSPAMAEVCAGDEMPRYAVVKQLWVYIKAHNLQNESNKRQIVCDEKLTSLFGKPTVEYVHRWRMLTLQLVRDGQEVGAVHAAGAPASMPGAADIGGATMEMGSGAGGTAFTPLSMLIQQYSRNPGQFQRHFWRHQMDLVENGHDADGKAIDFYNLGSVPNGSSSALPLARIKKVMKNDDEVKMISAEAPILFSRACEIFIADLTCRAFMVAEENKRRTIQRSDIANAIARSDLFDFLIDIVPRSEMVRNRSASAPIRNALPVSAVPSPLASAEMPGRGMGGMWDAKASPAGFLPLRPTQPQPDIRGGRMEMPEGALGMGQAPHTLKGMHKPQFSSNPDWNTGMYPFHAASAMGDTRMHPGTPNLGMPAHAAASTRVPRAGVDAAFMDANAPLSMPSQQTRGPFLNMVPYGMGDHQPKGEGGPQE
ncbi:CCAAT- binding transcription factor component [Malassezia sp. CBS 17886]|nr:CCAAT- binding transcription factor component [Malassezia sp. CBS 17886]